MSRFSVFGVLVVLCAIQYVCAKREFDDENNLQGLQGRVTFERESPEVVLARFQRSSKSRKPDSAVLKQLKRNTKVSQDRCKCEKQECSCCAKFSIEGKGDEGCASFKVPNGKTRNKLVRYSFNFNDETTNQVAPAGRDPKGVCQPWRRYPGVTICSRYHSTTVENGKIRWCLTMEGKYLGYTFYEMEFDCVTYDVENQVQVGTK